MTNKAIAAVSSVAAVLVASTIAVEVTGKVFGGTWNGPMWLTTRARYGLCSDKVMLLEGHDNIENFITDGGRGLLTVTVDAGGNISTSYRAPGTSIQPVNLPDAVKPKESTESSEVVVSPTAETPDAVELAASTELTVPKSSESSEESVPATQPAPVNVVVDDIKPNGDKVYYGWHGVWVWLNSVK